MSRISGVKQRGIGGTSKMNLRKDFKANFTDVFMKPIGIKSFFLETLSKHLQTYNVGTFAFPGRVLCDGYKKLINTSHEKSCICIGKRVQNI